MSDLTFPQWVAAKADSIAEARGVSVEDLATESGEFAAQLARVRQHIVAMGEVKADAKSWINKTRAVAVQEARRKYPDYTAEERKAMAESDPTYLAALKVHGDVQATSSALADMHYEALNHRRTSFNPKAHDND